jgi:hypothetical protein
MNSDSLSCAVCGRLIAPDGSGALAFLAKLVSPTWHRGQRTPHLWVHDGTCAQKFTEQVRSDWLAAKAKLELEAA